ARRAAGQAPPRIEAVVLSAAIAGRANTNAMARSQSLRVIRTLAEVYATVMPLPGGRRRREGNLLVNVLPLGAGHAGRGCRRDFRVVLPLVAYIMRATGQGHGNQQQDDSLHRTLLAAQLVHAGEGAIVGPALEVFVYTVIGRFAPQAFALLRIISGLLFLFHGAQKTL